MSTISYSPINIGSTANDGTGDSARQGGAKINSNFQQIVTAWGDIHMVAFTGDYNDLINKPSGIGGGGGSGTITSVNDDTGPVVVLTAADVGAVSPAELAAAIADIEGFTGTAEEIVDAAYEGWASPSDSVVIGFVDGEPATWSADLLLIDGDREILDGYATAIATLTSGKNPVTIQQPSTFYTAQGPSWVPTPANTLYVNTTTNEHALADGVTTYAALPKITYGASGGDGPYVEFAAATPFEAKTGAEEVVLTPATTLAMEEFTSITIASNIADIVLPTEVDPVASFNFKTTAAANFTIRVEELDADFITLDVPINIALRVTATSDITVGLETYASGYTRSEWSPNMLSGTTVAVASGTTRTFRAWLHPTAGAGSTPLLVFEGPLPIKQVVGKKAIWVPASAMISRTTSGAEKNQLESTTNKVMMDYLAYAHNADEFAQFQLKMPSGWNEGTLTASFVWTHPATTTNFDVTWALQAVAFANDDALDTAFGTPQVITDAGGTTHDTYISAETPAITVAGTPGAGEYVVFQAFRDSDGNGTAGNDDLAVDAWLLGAMVYYTDDTLIEA